MAKKTLSGKRYFEALGRRDRSMGFPANRPQFFAKHRADSLISPLWPEWARSAYVCGWLDQTAKWN